MVEDGPAPCVDESYRSFWKNNSILDLPISFFSDSRVRDFVESEPILRMNVPRECFAFAHLDHHSPGSTLFLSFCAKDSQQLWRGKYGSRGTIPHPTAELP